MSLPSYSREFCPYCGGKLSVREVEGKERDYCSECRRILWRNPKTAVAVAVEKGDELLLVKRGIEPDKGMYSLPAGFVDNGELPEKAAARELEEETEVSLNSGLLELLDTILLHRNDDQYTLVLVYNVEVEEAEAEPSSDVRETVFWSRDVFEERRDEVRKPYRDLISSTLKE